VRRLGRWIVPAAALAIIVGALLFDQPDTRSSEQRTVEIASSLRCPFCSGESIAESTSQVARDLQDVIREQVDAGRSDAEIVAYFEARYGQSVRLDPPLGGWGVALWVVPILAVGAGAFAIASLRRRSPDSPDGGPRDGGMAPAEREHEAPLERAG